MLPNDERGGGLSMSLTRSRRASLRPSSATGPQLSHTRSLNRARRKPLVGAWRARRARRAGRSGRRPSRLGHEPELLHDARDVVVVTTLVDLAVAHLSDAAEPELHRPPSGRNLALRGRERSRMRPARDRLRGLPSVTGDYVDELDLGVRERREPTLRVRPCTFLATKRLARRDIDELEVVRGQLLDPVEVIRVERVEQLLGNSVSHGASSATDRRARPADPTPSRAERIGDAPGAV